MCNVPTTATHPAHQPLPEGITCPKCRYDLRGSTSPRCPECGQDLNKIHAGESLIPWERRCEVGYLRAYLSTMWLALFNARRLCTHTKRAADPIAAWWFRVVTVMIASLPMTVTLLLALFYLDLGSTEIYSKLLWRSQEQLLRFIIMAYFVPGIFSHFFQVSWLAPLDRQTSVVRSFYAWSPLIFIGILECLPLGSLILKQVAWLITINRISTVGIIVLLLFQILRIWQFARIQFHESIGSRLLRLSGYLLFTLLFGFVIKPLAESPFHLYIVAQSFKP